LGAQYHHRARCEATLLTKAVTSGTSGTSSLRSWTSRSR
jgi:hypothetical protein